MLFRKQTARSADSAILLYLRVMSDGLLRISEVTELRIDDLEDSTLRVRFSKTDQEGSGEHLYLCEDTRQIVGKWLERSELSEGYLFRRMTARGDNLYRDKETPVSRMR